MGHNIISTTARYAHLSSALWKPQSSGSKGEQVFLARSLAKSEAYLIRLRPAAEGDRPERTA
jgi:hypothetical protein